MELLRRRMKHAVDAKPEGQAASRPPRPLSRSPSSRADTCVAVEGIVQGMRRRNSIRSPLHLQTPAAAARKENLERVVRTDVGGSGCCCWQTFAE